MERVFVYGTLRCGGSRDARRFYPGAQFLAPARVRGRLCDIGAYPGLRLAADGGWVRGEIFEVTPDALAGLDEWEGIDPASPDGGEYRRIRAMVEREDGSFEECWLYEIAERVCAGRPWIESGDWLAHDAERV